MSDEFSVDLDCRKLKQKLVPLIESDDFTADGLMSQALGAAQLNCWNISVLLTEFMSENAFKADQNAVEECIALLRQAAKKIEKKIFSYQREYLLNRASGLEHSLKVCLRRNV